MVVVKCHREEDDPTINNVIFSSTRKGLCNLVQFLGSTFAYFACFFKRKTCLRKKVVRSHPACSHIYTPVYLVHMYEHKYAKIWYFWIVSLRSLRVSCPEPWVTGLSGLTSCTLCEVCVCVCVCAHIHTHTLPKPHSYLSWRRSLLEVLSKITSQSKRQVLCINCRGQGNHYDPS